MSNPPVRHHHPALPLDIVLIIASHMPISKVKQAVMGWAACRKDKRYVLHHRCNIHYYMKQFFDEPEKVLDLMRACGVILTGCRGQEYFTPGTCVPESALEFYCTSSFTRKYAGKDVFICNMQKFGVEWEEKRGFVFPCGCNESCGHRTTLTDFMEDDLFMSLRSEACRRGILKHKDKKWPITITNQVEYWEPEEEEEDREPGEERDLATTQILHFPATVTQSFISGYGAISLYDDYTSNYEVIHWPQNLNAFLRYQERCMTERFRGVLINDVASYLPIRVESHLDPPKIVETFTGRGFKFVEYNSRGASAHGGADFMGRYGGRIRSMGDRGVLQISFQPYLNTSNWEIPFEVYWEAFNYITWYETPTRTAWLPGLFDILDFPSQRKTLDTCDAELKGSNQVFNLVERGVWYELWLEYKFDQVQENQKGCFSETLDEFKKFFMNECWFKPRSRYPC